MPYEKRNAARFRTSACIPNPDNISNVQTFLAKFFGASNPANALRVKLSALVFKRNVLRI